MSDLQQQVSEILKESNFLHYGFTQLTRPASLHLYEDWLAAGHHGDMEYLKRHLHKKSDPQTLLPQARSAIVVAQNYLPHPEASLPTEALRIALYARGKDYHQWLQAQLEEVITRLKSVFPEAEFAAFTDSAPILERDLAVRAGLGWVGKNGCVIHSQKGSLFLLGEIYTSLDLRSVEVQHPDRCGTCTRCLDICPTQAFVSPRVLDARKCISYLTIEQKKPAAQDLRAGIGDWFFGCDLCQTVCPWNEKVFTAKAMRDEREPQKDKAKLEHELQWILQAPHEVLKTEFINTPLLRRGPMGLKKNALVVIGNLRLKNLEAAVRPFVQDPDLGELAQWTLGQLC